MRLMSTPALCPARGTTRFPSMRTRVSFGSKPRRLGMTVPSPKPRVFWVLVLPISWGKLVSRSVALRMPSFSISAGRYVSTGFGPTSCCRGDVRTGDDDPFHFGGHFRGKGHWFSWADVPEGSSKPVVAIAHPTHQINGRLMTSSSL